MLPFLPPGFAFIAGPLRELSEKSVAGAVYFGQYGASGAFGEASGGTCGHVGDGASGSNNAAAPVAGPGRFHG